MDEKLLSLLAGIALSLGFSYIPGLKEWFEKQETRIKRLVMVGALLVISGGIFGLSCSGWWSWVSCDQAGVKGLVEGFVYALIANQSTYTLTK